MFDPYKGSDGDMVNCSKIHKHINNIVDGVIHSCETNVNFLNDIWKYTQFKLFFQNGYFDFKLNKFIESQNNKTFIKINKCYNGISNPEIKKQLFKKVLNPVFSIDDSKVSIAENIEQYQLMEYFLCLSSQFMAGNIQTKRWMNFQGLRDSGKGVLGDLFNNAFGKYISATNSSNFKFKSNDGDSQKALSWLIDYEFTRIALVSEVDIKDQDMKFNGGMIKKFASGGDLISARKNFKDEYNFKIQAGLIIMCNDMPVIQPTDANETCDEFIMKSKFIDEGFCEKKLKGYSYFNKDPSIKDEFVNREDVINEFLILILEYYNKDIKYPVKIKKQKNLEMEDDNDMDKLFNLYEITDNEEDKICNIDLDDDRKKLKLPFSSRKYKCLLKSEGAKDFVSNGKRGLCYIKKNEELEDIF